MDPSDTMSRNEKVRLVESFLKCMAESDMHHLPLSPEFTVETPLTPKLSGQAAMDYVKATAAGTRSIEVVMHIVEGNYVATLSENETVNGPLSVFAKFTLEAGRIRDARVFYDPRQILGSTA